MKINLKDKYGRVCLWGCEPTENGYLHAELAIFDASIGTKFTKLFKANSDEVVYRVRTPENAKRLEFPAAFDDIYLVLVD